MKKRQAKTKENQHTYHELTVIKVYAHQFSCLWSSFVNFYESQLF